MVGKSKNITKYESVSVLLSYDGQMGCIEHTNVQKPAKYVLLSMYDDDVANVTHVNGKMASWFSLFQFKGMHKIEQVN